jgi:hypothetical protein
MVILTRRVAEINKVAANIIFAATLLISPF